MAKTFTLPVAPGFLTGPSGILTGGKGSVTQLQNFQAGGPSLLDIYKQTPLLNIPGLTSGQSDVINMLTQAGTNNPYLAQSANQLQQLTSGPIGSSPATQAGEAAFQQFTAPQLLSQAALQGTASGGAALEALQQGQASALLPLIQQEIQNRANAATQYGQLGQQQIEGLAQALQAQGLPREVALEQAQAAYDQTNQQLQFASGLQTYPLSLVPATFGQESHTTLQGLDYLSGIGKGLSPGGLLGSAIGG